jgi:hypothetical protein
LLLDNLGREISRANRIGFHARASAFVAVRPSPHKGELVDLIGEERTAACGEDEVFDDEVKEKHVHNRNDSH